MKGLIGLDIDGTITHKKNSISPTVVSYLETLYKKGWVIALLTGRTYTFAKSILDSFTFPIFFSSQNGAYSLKRPENKLLYKNYLSKDLISKIDQITHNTEIGVTIYSGFDNNDTFYFRTNDFFKKYTDYISELSNRDNCKIVDTFDLDIINESSLIQCVGQYNFMIALSEKIKKNNLDSMFNHSFIRDPFTTDFFLLMLTSKQASKGLSLKRLHKDICKNQGTIIAAGNDDNDVTLLNAADTKIVVANAPPHLLEMADFIAPPPEENGIISALDNVIWRLEK